MHHRMKHAAMAGCLFTVLGVAAGCGGGDNSPPQQQPSPDGGGGDTSVPPGPDGSMPPGPLTLNKVANDATISHPFDATPDPTGAFVYFTATGANGAGVFKVAATGGAITEVFSGAPFVSPFSIAISTDGQTLYVADLGAETTANDGGAIFSLPVGGGMPSVLTGTDGVIPRGLEVIADQLYFTGSSPAGMTGVFKMPVAGGAVAPVATGAMFHEPSGVTATKAGDVYVVDTGSNTSTTARILKVSGGTPSVFLDGLAIGYPAGITLTMDESTLLLSALDPSKGTDAVIVVDLASNQSSLFTTGIDKFIEPAGLHRAKTKDVLAWADSTANSTGTVYVLSK